MCASLGRALGYPSRVTYGINPFPKNSPSHCKLEVFLPPYGWVSFDVSETQRLIDVIGNDAALATDRKQRLIESAENRLFSGFRDNTWFLQTRGTDYDLAPPAQKRVPVVRTIYAEADGLALPDPDPANADKREFAWMTAHKFTVGQTVRFSPDRNQEATGRGSFKIVRLLPEEASVFQYRVKSQADGHERVVREDQLVRS